MLIISLILCLATSACSEAQPPAQRHIQYIDAETRVVKRPEVESHDAPHRDGVWRSSWYDASLVDIQAKATGVYQRLESEHGVDFARGEPFLRYVRDRRTSGNEWKAVGGSV